MSDNIKLVYLNLVDQDATVITASTEASFYPVANLKDSRTTKKYRSTSASDNVVFDFITVEEVDTLIVRADIFTGRGFTGTLTFEANATDSWGSPAFTTTLTFQDSFNVGYKILAAAESYRFWRVVATGTSYVELSNICIGKAFIPSRNLSTDLDYEERDRSTYKTNSVGQRFQTIRNIQDFFNIKFKVLSKAQVEDFMTMFDATGNTGTIWVIPDNSEFFSPSNYRFASQFYLRKIPTYNHFSVGLYNLSLNLEEVI